MYILELLDHCGRSVRLEFIVDEGPGSAEHAEIALRQFLRTGASVRVYHTDGSGIRMVAESRERRRR